MNRKMVIWVIVIAFFVGALGSLALGRFAIPYLANVTGWSFLNKLSSTSPIVINRTQQVLINEGANLVDLIKQAGNTTVSILDANNNFLGNGVIATADGVIFTSDSIIHGRPNLKVVTNDGKSFPAQARAKDPKSQLVVLTIQASNLPVAQFDDASSLEAGQRVLVVGRSNAAYQHLALTGFVTQSLANLGTAPKQLSIGLTFTPDVYGGPIVNLSGHVAGLVLDNNQNIISENLKNDLNSYLSTGKITQ